MIKYQYDLCGCHSMTESGYTIGQFAAAAGVNPQTVRYYQRRGLLSQPPKPADGYRRYPAEALERLRFIKRAQGLGFTLDEIGYLLELADGRCADVQALARAKRNDVAHRIADLTRVRAALDDALAACARGDPDAHCPLIDALARDA